MPGRRFPLFPLHMLTADAKKAVLSLPKAMGRGSGEAAARVRAGVAKQIREVDPITFLELIMHGQPCPQYSTNAKGYVIVTGYETATIQQRIEIAQWLANRTTPRGMKNPEQAKEFEDIMAKRAEQQEEAVIDGLSKD